MKSSAKQVNVLPVRTAHWAGRTTKKNKSHTFLCKSMTFIGLVGGIVGAGHARPARGRQTSGNGEPAGRTCAAPTAQPWFSGAAYSKHTLRHSRPSHLQPGRNPSGRLRRPPPFDKGGFYLLWINFLSSPCFTAALSTTQVRNTSMGSIVVFFTRPEVK